MSAGHAYMAGTAAVYVDGVKLEGVLDVEYSSGGPGNSRAPSLPSTVPSSFCTTATFVSEISGDAFDALGDAFGTTRGSASLPSIAIDGYDVGLVTSIGEDGTLDVAPWPHVLRACEARARAWLACRPLPGRSLTSMIRAWWGLTNGRRARLNRRLEGRRS